MIAEMNSFVEKFEKFPGCYTVIGGMACDILMGSEGLQFRPTQDVDMILIIEDPQRDEFAQAFWEFIKEGRYTCGWRNNPDIHFYRFTDPLDGYPAQIELFSRLPDYEIKIPEGIIPVHLGDDVSSLSAILLDDDYYNFMLEGRRTIGGITVLDAEHLIPFKMYAWLELSEKKKNGEHVNERDLRKHRLDVFRLLTIVSGEARVECSDRIRAGPWQSRGRRCSCSAFRVMWKWKGTATSCSRRGPAGR